MKRTYNNLLSEQFHIRDKDNFSPYIIRIKKSPREGVIKRLPPFQNLGLLTIAHVKIRSVSQCLLIILSSNKILTSCKRHVFHQGPYYGKPIAVANTRHKTKESINLDLLLYFYSSTVHTSQILISLIIEDCNHICHSLRERFKYQCLCLLGAHKSHAIACKRSYELYLI